MGRLRRFEHHRYLGLRDTMTVYDCDDETQFGAVSDRLTAEDLVRLRQVQTFGPDTLAEARNRGFRPPRR
ncbi:MAG: hypothetical protein H0V96_03840 [Acidimicrobiia bacterium]|nr:hypothetical protein [Acidimicrobiia bacterium]